MNLHVAGHIILKEIEIFKFKEKICVQHRLNHVHHEIRLDMTQSLINYHSENFPTCQELTFLLGAFFCPPHAGLQKKGNSLCPCFTPGSIFIEILQEL